MTLGYRRLTLRSYVLTGAFALTASALLAFSRPPVMLVDGHRLAPDVPPVTTVNRGIFVPLRSLVDALGAQTSVHGDAIDVQRGNQSLHLTVGDMRATVNGRPLILKAAPFRVRGRVMVSLRPIAQAFDVSAIYDRRAGRVIVTTGVSAATTPPASQAQ